MWRLLAAMLLLLAVRPLGAEMYKWTDDQGVLHVGSSPPATPPKKSKVQRIGTKPLSVYNAPSGPAGDLKNLRGAPAPASVDVYVTSWCPSCKQAKAYLISKGIPFREYDVEADPAALDRARGLGYRGAIPFFVINGRSRTGFSPEWIDSAAASH